MTLIFSYSLRNLWTRRLTTILTGGGMALVSFVLAAALMLAEGLERTLIETGSPDNAIVLRGSAETEVSSIIDREDAGIIQVQPEVERTPDGEPLAAPEALILVALTKQTTDKVAHVQVRGVGSHSMQLRRQVKIVAGRSFRPGSHEVIVGSSISQRIKGGQLGGNLHFAMIDWKVVGVFDGSGTGFDSEVWGDSERLMAAFRRNSYSSMVVRVPGRTAFEALKNRLEHDPRLSAQVKREVQFYREQSEVMAKFIRILGTAMTIFFSLGAILGAMVTMYTAVANRTGEIGTLRALGFKRRSILAAFLGESLFLGLFGGMAGIVCSSFLQFITISTLNWETFSELAFGFRLTPQIATYTLGFAAAMGLLGGWLPAWRAARLGIVDALRAS